MDAIKAALDIFLHLDDHLKVIIEQWGMWTYALLFLIIFCETGLVVTPFLPGDSLLFAVGAIAAIAPDTLNVWMLIVLLSIAAIAGDTVNYVIGWWIGPKAFSGKIWFLKQQHLQQTQAFYEKYGGKTILLARFVPIVRTFAPFVAGVGKMNYAQFFFYNILGGIIWVVVCLLAGYFLGNIPFIKQNFELVAVAIVVVSILPMAWEYWTARRQPRAAASAVSPATDSST